MVTASFLGHGDRFLVPIPMSQEAASLLLQ